MSIRAGFDGDPPPGAARAKIRATLEPDNDSVPGPCAYVARTAPPEPVPARVMRFWHADEAGRAATNPWRYMESDDEREIREAAERDGSWAG